MINIEPRKHKVHSLTGRITDKTLLDAWKTVKRNKHSATGVDRVTVSTYAKRLEANLEELKKALKTRGAFKCPLLDVCTSRRGTLERRDLSESLAWPRR